MVVSKLVAMSKSVGVCIEALLSVGRIFDGRVVGGECVVRVLVLSVSLI